MQRKQINVSLYPEREVEKMSICRKSEFENCKTTQDEFDVCCQTFFPIYTCSSLSCRQKPLIHHFPLCSVLPAVHHKMLPSSSRLVAFQLRGVECTHTLSMSASSASQDKLSASFTLDAMGVAESLQNENVLPCVLGWTHWEDMYWLLNFRVWASENYHYERAQQAAFWVPNMWKKVTRRMFRRCIWRLVSMSNSESVRN